MDAKVRFIERLDDNTLIYQITLTDYARLDKPITINVSINNGEADIVEEDDEEE